MTNIYKFNMFSYQLKNAQDNGSFRMTKSHLAVEILDTNQSVFFGGSIVQKARDQQSPVLFFPIITSKRQLESPNNHSLHSPSLVIPTIFPIIQVRCPQVFSKLI
mmetsp:Transcript_14437/g.27149  ORF Transcript_14437/g.27149 Transcript_14437/m.27149 type:complete len:105 (-) Transcript_14437:2255-2569(-)